MSDRPDPDALLEKVQRAEAQSRRGRLKIFFGASAGVGKTYAMLATARTLQDRDIAIGVVETHSRTETEALVAGFEVLPLREVEYRGRTFREFDLDAALARRPDLLLLDELAHSNVAGSRHPKRWQDVEELLAAGIDVWTTLNVQHLETLNDVVGQITGIRVSETVPDKVFDAADDVALVDLPADELLRRLEEGKVYVPQQAERARQSFFRKGNLIALRELALRRTADRVDAQMREYRTDRSIHGVWQARERLLVCVGPGADAGRLVRSAGRLAAALRADWIALHIETPQLQRGAAERRRQALDALRLAQELGAETSTLAGEDLAAAVLGYARSRNVSRLVVGRSHRSLLARLVRPSLGDRLSGAVTDLDVLVVGSEPEDAEARRAVAAPPRFAPGSGASRRRWGFLWGLLGVGATTILALLLPHSLDRVNIAMLFLPAVAGVAARWGRSPGVFAALLSVASFDFFFVTPRFSFSVGDSEYLVTFLVMLGVALLIGSLAASLHFQARIALYREQRASALYEVARELSGALRREQIVAIAERHVEGSFQTRPAILLPDLESETMADSIAQWVYDHHQPAGAGTHTLPGAALYYLPLKAPMRTRGVLAIAPSPAASLFVPEQQRLLETFAAQIALALERVHYVEVAQEATVRIESERLRNSLLSALSHDLRTPLAVLMGLSSTLALPQPGAGEEQRELARDIHQEVVRMSALIDNLLDMARLQSGEVRLNRQWQLLEEVVGTALEARRAVLAGYRVRVDLPENLPLVEIDAVLIERVLCNLLENAAKYTPAGTEVAVEARAEEGALRVAVADRGPGLLPGQREAVFEKFTRGERESATSGVGLGLAICRAIVGAHGGRIWAEENPGGGARFVFTLPLGEPPSLDVEEDG